MNFPKSFNLAFVLCFFLGSILLSAHGLEVTLSPLHDGIIIQSAYHGHQPLVNARVEIYYGDERVLFQSGRTDIKGRFCFQPDQPGRYHLSVDDQLGHKKSLQFVFEDRQKPRAKSPDPTGDTPEKKAPVAGAPPIRTGCPLIKALLGISLILLLTLSLLLVKKKK